MQTSISLDDDLDDVELIKALENAFGVKLVNGEAWHCRTVADLYAIFLSKFPSEDQRGRGCATAFAFYRLRRALIEVGVMERIGPKTPLDPICKPSVKSMFKELQDRSTLKLPRPASGWLGTSGTLLLIASFLLACFDCSQGLNIFHWPLLLALAGALLAKLDRMKLPRNCQTIGDLAEQTAALNFGRLVSTGAGHREKDIWNALVEVIAMHSQLPKSDIGRDTILLQSQLKPSRL